MPNKWTSRLCPSVPGFPEHWNHGSADPDENLKVVDREKVSAAAAETETETETVSCNNQVTSLNLAPFGAVLLLWQNKLGPTIQLCLIA